MLTTALVIALGCLEGDRGSAPQDATAPGQ